MRIDVKKFLFIGATEDRDPFFQKAQDQGIIHFIDKEESKKIKGVPKEIENLIHARKVLRGLPTMEQEEIDGHALADGIASKILEIKHQIEKLEEENRVLRLEISRVEVFGDFSLEDIEAIERKGKRKIQFFFARHGIAQLMELPDELIYINSDHNLDYFVSISPKPIQYDKMIEMKIEQPLGILLKRKKEVESEILILEAGLKSYAKYNKFLHSALHEKMNVYELNTAKSLVAFEFDDHLFAVQGWVPQDKLGQLDQITQDLSVHAEEIAIDPKDTIPTYLENTGTGRIGEDLVHIYDTPSHTDKDPSNWVLWSFALFFAMIVGDGGYGMILLAFSLFLRYKIKDPKPLGKRLLNLMTILSVGCIIWGIFTSSFFGIKFSPENPLRKFSGLQWVAERKAAYHFNKKDAVYQDWIKQFPELEQETDPYQFLIKAVRFSGEGDQAYPTYVMVDKFYDNIMMELAILVGVLHVILSLLRYLPRNWSNLGWIVLIVGAYLYIPAYLQATSLFTYAFGIERPRAAEEGLILIYGGLGLAVVLAIIQRKLLGFLEITNIIQLFADILSYLRLYALGLAGAIVSSTINEAASSVLFVFGIIIVLVGHTLNVLLCIVGGIIHGLRLNFIEWYHYSFEGGGKLFKPLQKYVE